MYLLLVYLLLVYLLTVLHACNNIANAWNNVKRCTLKKGLAAVLAFCLWQKVLGSLAYDSQLCPI